MTLRTKGEQKAYLDCMCTQYDIVVAPTDGCSNGEKGENNNGN